MATYHYYSWNSSKTKTCRKTPKQFRLINDAGTATVLKPKRYFNSLNATIHTLTFADGSTRQWFFKGERGHGFNGDEKTVEDYAKTLKQLGRAVKIWDEFGFIQHPDDKVFYRDRIVYHHKWKAEYDEGRSRSLISYNGKCDGERRGGMPRREVPVHRTYVVCETWVKWGMLDILLDDGLKHWGTYDIGDNLVDQLAPRKGKCLHLTEFRSSPEPNPFDDPFEPELKEIRDRRNALTRELAEVVFHPARLERMMDAYGDDWLERV